MGTAAHQIVVTGSSGLIGTALVRQLRADGHRVVGLVRRAPKVDEIQWDPAAGQLRGGDLEGVDAVVHLAGAGIADHRWTASYKQEILRSRVDSTLLLARTLASLDRPPPVWLSGSAIGIYGARGDEELDETSQAGTGFLAEVCEAWEQSTEPAAASGIRVAHLRTGIVLTARGGALAKQLPLFKLGLGGKLGSGHQWQSWISLDDEVRAIAHLLAADVHGPVNLAAPNPVTNAEFTDVLARVLHRPHLPAIPSFGPKLLLGAELADHLLFTGQRVRPRALSVSGFSFSHPELEPALRAILAGRDPVRT